MIGGVTYCGYYPLKTGNFFVIGFTWALLTLISASFISVEKELNSAARIAQNPCAIRVSRFVIIIP